MPTTTYRTGHNPTSCRARWLLIPLVAALAGVFAWLILGDPPRSASLIPMALFACSWELIRHFLSHGRAVVTEKLSPPS